MVGTLLCCSCVGGARGSGKAGTHRRTYRPERTGARYGSISSRARGAAPGPSMTLSLGQAILVWYSGLVLIFFFAINSYRLALTVAGFHRALRVFRQVRRADQRRLLRSPLTPPVSVLAPAFNEEATVVENVRSLLSLDYPLFEVVLVNDGSQDGTLCRLIEAFDLKQSPRTFEHTLRCKPIRGIYESPTRPNLVVVDKVNGGRPDALNAGLNLSLYPLFCAVDADSVLAPDALLRLVRPFIDAPGITIAVGGVIGVANGCDIHRAPEVRLPSRPLPLIQILEYLRAFLVGPVGWSTGTNLLALLGAFGLFDKQAVIMAGGHATDSVGENMELLVRMHRHRREQHLPYHIGFIPDSICWTQAPESLRALRHQRANWQRGLLETLLRHRGLIGRPRYGRVGMVALRVPAAPAALGQRDLEPVSREYVSCGLSHVRGVDFSAGSLAGGPGVPAVFPDRRSCSPLVGRGAGKLWLSAAHRVVASPGVRRVPARRPLLERDGTPGGSGHCMTISLRSSSGYVCCNASPPKKSPGPPVHSGAAW